MEDDTIKLLRECNAGIKMGISSLEDSIENAENETLRDLLMKSRDVHCRLGDETHEYLKEYHEEGKEPPTMAKIMSKVKENMKMISNEIDASIADFVTDGCNMGVKTLNKYLNQYPTAIEKVKELVGKVIKEEETLVKNIKVYL